MRRNFWFQGAHTTQRGPLRAELEKEAADERAAQLRANAAGMEKKAEEMKDDANKELNQ